MRFLKKHKSKAKYVLVGLLFLCLIPMGCGGSSDAEPKTPPKTNYELEDMIKELSDSLKVVKQDINDIQADVKAIDKKNYDDDIDDLQDQIDELLDMLPQPTPTPTGGAQPTPEPTNTGSPQTGVTITLDPNDKFLGNTENAEIVIRNNSGDDIIDPTLLIRFTSNSKVDDMTGSTCTLTGGTPDTPSFYTSTEGTIAIYPFEMEGMFIPTGGKATANLVFDDGVAVYWTPSVTLE